MASEAEDWCCSGPGREWRLAPPPNQWQVDPKALEEVRGVLGERPRRRDLLIEHLHLLQDHFGYISAAHLCALAAEMQMAATDVYDVAAFYAHFDLANDGETPPVTVRVCDGIACAMAGTARLRDTLATQLGPDARVVPAPCIGACDSAPNGAVANALIRRLSTDKVYAALAAGIHPHANKAEQDLAAYLKAGGYRLLRACLAGTRRREDVIAAVSDARLRGFGGAGFPTGRKWSQVRAGPAPRLMCVNADEGEPGTFKDRFYLERDPHRFLEGMLVAAWVVEAADIYLYLRDEYPEIRLMLGEEIARLDRVPGLAGRARLHLRRGAGAYICGEESAMIESIEGKRGLPRRRPPSMAEVGLFGRPTLVQNVETLYWVRDIIEKGAAWFAAQGRHGASGLRSFSVSGRVKSPGVKLAPAGITARELIDEFCGGMADGEIFKAYLPGGASGGILPAALGDLPLDFGALEPYGCSVGSHGVVVFSVRDDMKAVALNLMRFFADENCGQCPPCRDGTEEAALLMTQVPWQTNRLVELARAIRTGAICGLGEAAPNALLCVLKYFPEDLARPLGHWD